MFMRLLVYCIYFVSMDLWLRMKTSGSGLVLIIEAPAWFLICVSNVYLLMLSALQPSNLKLRYSNTLLRSHVVSESCFNEFHSNFVHSFIIAFLNLKNNLPCSGFVKKSVVISPVGQYSTDSSFLLIQSLMK
jgi:hypothetical protein